MKLKDSQTYLNLARAFAGECAARTRYEFCEYGFRYNGYEAIATLIDKIAYQEFNHARVLYTHIQDAELKQIDNIDINAGYPFKEKWDMLSNLKLLAEDEKDEAKTYETFAKTAMEEGFDDIAKTFEMIKDVESRHAKVFEELYNQMKNKTLYKKAKQVAWVCPNCGYVSFDKEAWETCPLCQAKQGVCDIKLPQELYF
jgi:rubrerythrin